MAEGNVEMEEEMVTQPDDLRDGEYLVEQIIGKQIVGGKTQYLIKWEGYSIEECTWEAAENFRCPDLIEKFEEQRSTARGKTRKRAAPSPAVKQVDHARAAVAQNAVKQETKEEIVTLDGKEPEVILGANQVNGELVFLVAWKGLESAGVVRASECNVKIPKLVIDFYQNRIVWGDDMKSETKRALTKLKINS